jgi:hypothetical protein
MEVRSLFTYEPANSGMVEVHIEEFCRVIRIKIEE